MRPMPIDDPRDNLEKATRWELYEFAKRMGCDEVKEPMPHLLAAEILRAKGLHNIQTNVPPLGAVAVLGSSPHVTADKTVDALSDLKRQYMEQQANPDVPPKAARLNVDEMKFNDIRAELKRRGVKLSRKDTLQVLREKLKQNG